MRQLSIVDFTEKVYALARPFLIIVDLIGTVITIFVQFRKAGALTSYNKLDFIAFAAVSKILLYSPET